MTNRRRATPAYRILLAAAMGVCLTTACGVVPGGSGGGGTLTVVTFAPMDTKATNMPGMPGMAKAYERWVNSNGGINGRKLRVLTCNEKNTATGAADCARKAISEKAVAVVGSYSQHGRAFMAPLEAEGIPFIGGYGVSAEEFQSTLSYPVNGGQPALLAGAGHQLGRACSQVALVRPDTLAGDSMPVLLNAGLKANRIPEADDIRAAEDAADLAPQAREALAGTPAPTGGPTTGATGSPSSSASTPATGSTSKDGTAKGDTSAAAKDTGPKDNKSCVAAVLGARTETFFDSFRRIDAQGSRKNPQISSVLGSVSQSLVDRTGGKESPLEGAFITSWYPVAGDPLWAPMRKVISEQAFGDDTVDPDDSGAQTTWIAYSVLTEIVQRFKKDEDVTARKVARALNQSSSVKTGGLTPDLSWRYQDMRAVAGFPRLVNGRVTFQIVQAGRLVAQPGEQSLDMTQTLEQAPRST
ncbi:ABC transporter substrate-binding protein [Streptomyces sp. NBC_00249]|uniref:ABC transporter substrate-binding protein n=1 Tax=Streptomyces sp. NBC_00249 TaxID=2975690 RepID=UPI00224F538A|nr:ABC transporter substrate-binding protein [Streptomyces sp. NBC_00249]MCX5198617.1 ABC transporter substrate-binding protein [Streptomyces sp. NBC_00249]